MAKQYPGITDEQSAFIENQMIFFVGTAAQDGRVNVSPKGMDTFRVIDANTIVWLNLTGSGNETAAHLLKNDRMTIMFCAFEGKPLILRLYGRARAHHEGDKEYDLHITRFAEHKGARQIMLMNIDLVQTSCGFAVPLMEYRDDRSVLKDWADKKGRAGVKDYQKQKNIISIDGFETGMES